MTITAKDFERLPERAAKLIERHGIDSFIQATGLSKRTLTRIKMRMGKMSTPTALIMIDALQLLDPEYKL